MSLTAVAKPFFRAMGSTVLLGILFFTPATAAEVSATTSDPGATPGDLFQGAVIDAPSTPARSGFDLRDIFGGQFSSLEPGRTVLPDNQGSAVQSVYFHTAVPVTLSSYQLHLGDDAAGRGASQVEVAVTDASFSSNTVISTVNLVSPYPSAIGGNSMRHILVSDSFAPVTGQYFVIRFTPATPNSGVRVIEFDGVAPSGILAATHVDFSTAGFTGAATAQTPVRGFTYGYYTGANATTEGGAVSFSTTGMGQGSFNGASEWVGAESGTPAHNPYLGMHPALSSLHSGVRRYVVGAGGEPSYTGSVRIVGSFWDLNSGQTSGFISVDGVVKFPLTPVNGPVPFDLAADVAPASKIDFGVTANGDGASSDATGFLAWVVTGDTAVPTGLVANIYGSPYGYGGAGEQNVRRTCFAVASDGVVSATDAGSFDTAPSAAAFPYAFAGLLYLENAGSGKATRFDSVRIDVTTSGDFSDTPRLYLLRHNSDPNTSNPAADDRYARLPLVPVRTINVAGEPSYSFDLSTLSEAESTGYGFAVVGAGLYQGNAIAVSEISATAVRVADTGVIAPQPFFVQWTNNHRYALTMIRGDWDQAEAEAVSFGGHLLSLNSTEENDFITSTFGFTEEFFIGLRQNLSSPNFSEPAGGFEWVNGDPVTFTNWHGPAFGGSEPNHAFGAGEDYAVMGYFQTPTGTWGDAKKAGYPETSNYRGIIELPTPGAGEQNFSIPAISAKSNIFDAGLASATQGGVLPPSLTVTGLAGQLVTFPKIVGVLNTAADVHGPDGAHTAGRSCDLTGVGGISGYLNGSNTPALVGVFLGAAQPAQQPERLDFSTSALGENFTLLAPALGQVFFIGDGFTSTGQAQEFIIPAGAERLYFGVPDGNNGTLYHGTPLGYSDNTGTMSIRASVLPSATPFFASTNFPAAGGQLTANGGTGPYEFAVIGGSLPPHLSLSASGNVTSSGQPRVNGSYAFTVRVTDSASATADKQFTVVVADPVDVPSGIVAWWPGDNGVNEIIGGSHGAFNNVAFDTLALQNGSAYRAGKVGRGFSFDGVDDFIEVANHSSLSLAGDMTIEAWVESTAATGFRTIADKRSADGSTASYIFQIRDNVLWLSVQSSAGALASANSGFVLPAGKNHLAATVSGTTVRIYVNGASVYEASNFPAARAVTDGPLAIGATRNQTNTFNKFTGMIDELSLYNRALTAGEISTIYAAGAGGKKRADAARDFTLAANPNGVWSYRELSPASSLTTYVRTEAALMTTSDAGVIGGKIDGWSTQAGISLNRTNDFVVVPSGGTQYDWLPRGLGWGVGFPGGERAVLRWTAPSAGRYAISANFTGADTLPGSTDVHIRHNAEVKFDGIVSSYRGNGLSSTSTITAAAGDTVDFILGANGSTSFDTSAISASVVFISVPLELAADFPEQPSDPQTPWQPLTATGGTGPYTFAVTTGALPAALVLAPDGSISGTLAATPGRTTFTVTATDAVGASVSKNYTLVVAQEFALPLGATTWFPGELHPHDVVGGALGVASGFPVSGPYGAGKSGTGFVFDGVDDALTVSDNAALNALPLTIEAWIKPELRPGNAADFWPTNIISGDRAQFGGHGIGANVFADGSHLWIEVQHTSPAQAFRRVPGDHFRAGEWAHVALVLTSGNAKTYVNGSLVDDFNFSQGTMDADPFFRIGRHNEDAGYPVGQRFFKGAIDEVTTYNRALSAAEILNIVNTDWIGKNRDDAARDFFTQTNVVGQLWQYGQMGTGLAPVGTTFARYTTVGSENALRYWRNGAAPDPNVIKNTGDAPYLHWAPGQLSVHPGPGPERIYSAVRWTAPAPGRYALFSEYSRLNTQVGTASIYLFKGENSFGSKTITDTLRKDTIFGTSFVQAGDTVDFVVGSRDDFGFDAIGITPSVALLEPAPRLPEITNLGIQTKFPVANLSLWHFTATRAPDPVGVTSTLALQFSATPEIESSWTALQTVLSSSLLINKPAGSNVWLADATLSFTPGSYYFRIVQSAAGYATATSAVFGNEALIGGTGEAGPIVIGELQPPTAVTNLKITTAKPPAAGKKWSFQVDYPRDAVLLLVQYSLTPNDPASWSYLPGDASLVRPDANGKVPTTWTLDVPRLSIPGGNVFFRIESTTSLLGGRSSYSAPFGAEAIAGAKAGTTGPIAVKNPAKLTTDVQAKLWVNSNGTPIENNLVHIGEEIAYEISYRNHGEAVATGVSITVMVPPQLELLSATGTTSPIRKNPRDPNSEIIGMRLDIGTLSPSQNFQRRRIIARVRDDAKKPGRGVVNLVGTALVESPDFPDQKFDLPFLAIADPLRVGLRVAGSEFEFPKGATIPLLFTAENKSPAALTNALASVKIPAGAFVDSFLEDNETSAERLLDTNGNTILKFDFGAMPANTSRVVFLNLRTPFDTSRNVIFTGNPAKDDPGYTFTAFNAAAKKTLVAIGDGFSVNLTNAIVRPPQLDLGKEVTGATLQGRQTFGIPYKESAKAQERIVRGAIVAPNGEVTFTLNYRNAGEGTAKECEIFDDIDSRYFTLVPDSIRLNGQTVSIGGNFRLFNGTKPIGPNESLANRDLRLADFFKIRVGDLGAGEGGVLTYRVVAAKYASKKLTPTAPGQVIGAGPGSIFTESLVGGIGGQPEALAVQVAKPYEFRLEYKRQPGFARAGNVLRFALKYTNAGQLPAYNAFINLPIPVGTTGHSAFFVRTDTADIRALASDESLPAGFTGATTPKRFELGTLDPGETGEVAIYLTVNAPLNQAIADAGEVRISPFIDAFQTSQTALRTPRTNQRLRVPLPKLAGALKLDGAIPVAIPSAPKLFIGRAVPITATKNGTMDVTIFFGNAGDTAATGGNVAMQIPFETTFLSATDVQMTRPSDPSNQTNLADFRYTLTTRTEKKGSRIERIIVDLPTLPAHSSGAFTMKLKVAEKFGAAAVEDSSCRIVANNARSQVAHAFNTQVRSAEWYFSIFESVNASIWSFGSWVAGQHKATVQEEFKALTKDSQFYSVRGLDLVTLKNGANFAPIGFNRGLIVGPSRLVAAGGGNMVAAGGLNMVAAGGGNLIGIKNAPGFSGTATLSQLVPAIPSMVAAGGGNLVAAGGGNLIGLDGSTLIGNDGSTLVGNDGASLIGNDGSTLIGNDGSTMRGLNNASLIGLDGSTFSTISMFQGSPRFTPVAGGAGIVATFRPSNMVAAGGGNMVAAGGGNMVAAGGGNMVAAGGGNMVAAGGGN